MDRYYYVVMAPLDVGPHSKADVLSGPFATKELALLSLEAFRSSFGDAKCTLMVAETVEDGVEDE